MHAIAFANGKGGVGKSTLALNTAVELATAGHQVLVYDTDPQRTSARFCHIREERLETNLPIFDIVQLNTPTLHTQVPRLGSRFDYVILDCGGWNDDMLRSALAAASTVVVPLGPSAADYWGSHQTIKELDRLAMALPHRRSLALLTKTDDRTKIARGTRATLEEDAKEHHIELLPFGITNRVAWPESLGAGLGVGELGSRGRAAHAELRALVQKLKEVTP